MQASPDHAAWVFLTLSLAVAGDAYCTIYSRGSNILSKGADRGRNLSVIANQDAELSGSNIKYTYR